MEFAQAIGWLVLGLEAVAAAIVVAGGGASLWVAARRQSLRAGRLLFGHSLLYALDFTIAADVLKLAAVPDLRSAAVAAGTVAVRVVLTVLLLWEVTHEKEL